MSSSSSSSDSNSSATISRRVGSPIPYEGPSRVRSQPRSRRELPLDKSNSDDVPNNASESNPWDDIVSTVKQQAHLIKQKYYIPNSYEVIIPSVSDRMHRPPPGFCAFSLNHFDAGLRLPLTPYIAQILRRLEARLTQRIRASQAQTAAEASVPQGNPQVAPPSTISSRPASTTPLALEGPSNPPPIVIGSEETRSRGLPRDVSHEVDSPNRSRTDESSPGGLVTRRRKRGKSPMGPKARSRSQSLRVDQRSDFLADGRNMEVLNDIISCWRKARKELRTPNHLSAELHGEKFIPDWRVSSNSTVLGSQSGQET
ncbi:UNVERIFIED_CONTAM: hypothetical protein Sindi_0158600 [Sesamum indicum]